MDEAQYWNARLASLSLVPRLAPAVPPKKSGRNFLGRDFLGRDNSTLFLNAPQAYGQTMDTAITDTLLRKVLTQSKTFACVGVSPNPVRPSHFVARYLSLRNYTVIPINPGHAGARHFGTTFVASLADLPIDTPIDVLDIFRRSEHVPPIVEEAIDRFPSLKVIWMQVGVENEDAAKMARARGLTVIQNRCPKIEHQRLFGELRKGGFNTGIISSKL